MAGIQKDRNHWHLAARGAIELELRDNSGDLEFDHEYVLNKESLQMDVLILKVNGNAEIKNEIGHIFKKFNIIEYKGFRDSVTIDKLFKTVGYAFIYKGQGKMVNAVPTWELTVSVLTYGKPVKLFKDLDKIGAAVEERYKGIYYIKGITVLDIQLIVFKELDRENHCFFRSLASGISEEDARGLLKVSSEMETPGDRANMDAILEVSVRANRELYSRLKKEGEDMCQALRELMQDEFDAEREKTTKEVTEKVTEEVTEKVTEKVTESNTILYIKALMETAHVDMSKAMEMLQIPSANWEGLKQKMEPSKP